MTRAGPRPAAMDAPAWVAVSEKRPCPCCGETRGCGTADEAGFVHCRLLVSSRPIAGGGWLHVLAPPRSAEGRAAGSPAPPGTAAPPLRPL
jgi:hypothetical protein